MKERKPSDSPLYLARLLVEKRSGAANAATILRFALGAAIAPVFVRLGLCGWHWGMEAATFPLAADVWLTRRFALAGLRALPERSDDAPADVSVWSQVKFTVPLSVGERLSSILQTRKRCKRSLREGGRPNQCQDYLASATRLPEKPTPYFRTWMPSASISAA